MLQSTFFFIILAAATAAFLVLLHPFFLPILWAAVLATVFHPVYAKLLQRLPDRQNLCALITMLTAIALVIVPVLLITLAVINEGASLYGRLNRGEIDISKAITWFQTTLPAVTGFIEGLGVSIDQLKQNLSSGAVQASRWLAGNLLSIGQNAVAFVAMLFVMLYLLFFLLRDGGKLGELIVKVLPIGDTRERLLFAKFAEVSRATLKGTLIVGIVQGALGGLLFWILGIDSAVFWGVVMTILSIIPAVGSALVWAPAAIILIANGLLIKGIILIAFGVLVIGLADNVLRPILVGRDTKMPDYLILLSTLGGLYLFGISGLILGPVIAAFFLAVWAMFAEEYNPENHP